MQTQSVNDRTLRRAAPAAKGMIRKGASAPLVVSEGRKRADGAQPPASSPPSSKPAEPPKTPASDKGDGKKGSVVPAAAASRAPEPAKPDDSKKSSHEPVLIVFGLTEKGLPQGSWFSGVDAEVAIRSARLMKLRAIKVTSQAQ